MEELTKIQRRLIVVMEEYDLEDEDIYRFTGYHTDEFKTIEDFNEIIRILSNLYFGLDKYYLDTEE